MRIGDEQPCANGQGMFFGEGSHTLEVIATDAAGNRGTSSVSFSVDCVVPAPLGNAILRLSFEDGASAQQLANAANASSPATRGDTTDVETRDPSFSPAGRYGASMRYARDELDAAQWSDPLGETPYTAFTIEAWVRPNPPASNGESAMVYRQGTGWFFFSYSSYDDAARFAVSFGDPDRNVSANVSADPVAFDTWHHTLVVYDGSTLRLYVDGVQYTSTDGSQAGGRLSFYWMCIGAGDSWSSTPGTMEGWLDEVTISTSALSAADARARYCPYP